jgi:hypothetical protein
VLLITYKNINKLYCGRMYGIETNDKRLINEQKNGYIKCYVAKQKGFVMYIDNNKIKNNNSWKVITTEASHKHESGFGNMFIGKPNEVHTGSYISFETNTEIEAKSLMSYMSTKFSNLMLSLRKCSQHVNSDTIKWIPLVPLDKIWTDEMIYKYFELTKDEIDLISNTNVTGYKELDS